MGWYQWCGHHDMLWSRGIAYLEGKCIDCLYIVLAESLMSSNFVKVARDKATTLVTRPPLDHVIVEVV